MMNSWVNQKLSKNTTYNITTRSLATVLHKSSEIISSEQIQNSIDFLGISQFDNIIIIR